MLFSIDFVGNVLYLLLFAVAVMAIYYALPGKGKPALLFVSGAVFYTLSDWKMAAVLVLTMGWTWLCASRMQRGIARAG